MAQNKTLEFWNGLPTWSKGVIAVGGLAVVYFAARGIWKRIRTNIDRQQDLRVAQDSKRELQQLERQGIRRTLSDSQLEAFSQKLVQAFDSCGTTEESVYSIFRSMKNKADVLALISIYGIRKYDQCNMTEGFGDNEYSLPRAMESELDASETKIVNDILAAKKIDYTF